MSKREKFVSKALGYKGYNCSHFIQVMSDYGAEYGDAWCAWFVSTVARECNLANVITFSGGAGSIPRHSVAANKGKWLEGYNSTPQAGDVIVFTWNGLGTYEGSGMDKYYSDHVGIVYKVDSTYVYTVEGNANGSNTSSTVCCKQYPLYSGKINGYYRPSWTLVGDDGKDEEVMEFKKGNKSNAVLMYKSLIREAHSLGIIKNNCDESDSFGDGTDKATREIQKKYGLVVDGVAGVRTITALRNAVSKAQNKLIYPSEISSGWGIGVRMAKICLRTLQKKGTIKTKPDGKYGYGAGTKKAIKEVQAAAKIKQDGIIGSATANAIEKLLQEN